jgi:hypothetical protein
VGCETYSGLLKILPSAEPSKEDATKAIRTMTAILASDFKN